MRTRYPGLPYVAPFVAFLVLLSVPQYLTIPPSIELPLRNVLLAAVLWLFSREVIDFRSRKFFWSVAIGVAVFAAWILPDLLFPAYRDFWLFDNKLLGSRKVSLAAGALADPWVLSMRSIRAVFLVPAIEELFWRSWLMRWLISPRFQDVRLGAYDTSAFLITAILFATEHGPYWDVGLLAGFVYNGWMIRTRSLGDCILAHAVTNACLCGYVIATHHWEYWL